MNNRQPAPNETIKTIGNYSYDVMKCLGEGAFGKVYEGLFIPNGQRVAIKRLDLRQIEANDYLKNAINMEISILKKFKHENIVEFIDFLASKNSLYLIMEFCEQGDLKRYLRKNPNLTEQQLQDVLKQIICGFHELNRMKVTHRDLKPANILVSNNTFKIADFGFAKHVSNFDKQMLKSCVGSPIYMAPQILSKMPYTTKSDIWSLGVMCHEMFYKQLPWIGNSEEHLLMNIKSQPLKERPGPTWKLIKRMLEYEEERRIDWDELFVWAGIVKDASQDVLDKVLQSPLSSSPVSRQPSAISIPSKPRSPSVSPAKDVPKRIQTIKDQTQEEVWMVAYVTLDFFSRIRALKKLCESNAVLEKLLYLLSRLLSKKSEGVTNKKLVDHVREVNTDIVDYLSLHKKYNSLKSEYMHWLKEDQLLAAMKAELDELRNSNAGNSKLFQQTHKVSRLLKVYSSRLGFTQMLMELRCPD